MGRTLRGQSRTRILEAINASIDFDRHLYAQDIAGSQAHARMLAKQGIITAADGEEDRPGPRPPFCARSSAASSSSRGRWRTSTDTWRRGLTALIGPAAGRLHTARSRNDQVATDFRLYIRDAIDAIDRSLADLQQALAEQALAARRHGHARLHAPADRAAGDVRSSSACLRRDAGARPRPARRRPQAAERDRRSAPPRSPAPPSPSTAT